MYVKAPIPSEVYHLTRRDKLESILDDGAIRRFDDTECWFCESLAKMKAYMEQTVLCEGKPYYGAGGQLCRYPKFEPDEHIILKLTPCRREGNWYRWNQEIPLNSPPELVQVAAEFSKLKIGFRGDLPFRNAEAIDVAEFLHGSIVCPVTECYVRYYSAFFENVKKNRQNPAAPPKNDRICGKIAPIFICGMPLTEPGKRAIVKSIKRQRRRHVPAAAMQQREAHMV